jgi:hypothetical protein
MRAMIAIAVRLNAVHGNHCDAWRAHTWVRPYRMADQYTAIPNEYATPLYNLNTLDTDRLWYTAF